MAKQKTLETSLVHIPAGSAGLSKEQKTFNRLTKRIEQLEKDRADFQAGATRLRQRVQAEYRPLQQQHNDQRAALVRVLDRAYDAYKLTKAERAKIVSLVVHGCYDLLDRGYADLEGIFDKFDPPLSPEQQAAEDEANRAADAQTAELMKQLFQAQFGIEFDPAADVSSPEKMQAYVDAQLTAREEAFARQQAQATKRGAGRRKSPRQQAAEEKKKTAEKNCTQAVRTLYLDLVKTLHPDREPDADEKIRKTTLLQQVTTAYEKNELLTLLRLQLELQRVEQAHFENLAQEQLGYYNQLLRQQVREQEQQLAQEQQDLSAFTGQPWYYLTTASAMDLDYQRQKAQLEAKVRQLSADVQAYAADPAALKQFLKKYKIPKDSAGPPLSWL